MMKVSAKLCATPCFCAKSDNEKRKTASDDNNPISKGGEKAVLLKGAVLAGIGFGARCLYYIFDDTSVIESTFEWGEKIAKKKAKDAKGWKLTILQLGSTAAIIGGFIAICAAIYTIYKVPEISYKSKINAHVKGKDMDLYIKGNQVEKELYNQMNDKAKTATDEEKKTLATQYLKLRAAKNEVPLSVSVNKS